MIKSESMVNLIQLRLAEAGLKHLIESSTLDIILNTIEEQINQPGIICVEGEWSVCPPWMVDKVKEVMN